MFEKYVRKIIEYRILLSGVNLIAVGTFLGYIGQNYGNKFNDKPLRQSISEKTSQIDKLVSSKSELLSRIDSQKVIAFEPLTDEEKETIPQVIPRTDSSDVIVQVKSLYNKGKYDEA